MMSLFNRFSLLLFLFLFVVVISDSFSQIPPASIADSLVTKEGWEQYIEAQIEIAVENRRNENYKESEKALSELSGLTKEKLDPDHVLEGYIAHQKGVLFYVQDENDKAIKHYHDAIRIRRKAFVNNNSDLAQSLHNLGVAFRYKGNYSDAIKPLEEAIAIREALELKKKQADSYNQLGIVYENLGDYTRSLECTQLALDLFKASVPENEFWYVAQCHRDMGIVLRLIKRPDEALVQFESALDIYKGLFGEQDHDVADCYNNIGISYWEKKEYKKAIEALEKSLSLNRQLFKESNKRFLWNYNNLGLVTTAMGEYERSSGYLEKAISEGKQYYGEFHSELARSYENYGDNAVYEKSFRVAVQRYQVAIINCFANFRDTSIYSNPSLVDHDIWADKTELLSFLSSKAKGLQSLYASGKGNLKDIETAFTTFLLADELIDLIQKDFREEGSTLILLEKAIPMYEAAIATTLQLAEIKKDEKLKAKAFNLAEKSKAVVLLGTIKELKAKDFGGVPQELLDEENSIKQELAHQEKLLVETLRGGEGASVQLADIRNRILQLKQSYESFTKRLEEEYSAYHNLKYGGKVASLQEVRNKLLDEKTLFLEYFIGNDKNYIFAISQSGFEVFQSDKDQFPENDLTWLINFISKSESSSEDKLRYGNTAFNIYSTLLPNGILETIEKLIIIPDGLLSYIPFEVLLTDQPTENVSFKRLPYLLKKAAVGYAYSATTLIENQERSNFASGRKVLAMAPIFEESDHFKPLLYSQEELKFLEKKFNTNALEGDLATKANFLEEGGHFDIIHLSTHASAEDNLESAAWIAFSDLGKEEEDDYKLSLNDLYAMRLKAAMVVLSACETGSGKIARGEGVMSLARGFAYAGCQSIVTTLWQVNNQSTADIMERFYRNLEGGITKDAALQRSKLEYLEDDAIDELGAHPYYWAAYVPIGSLQSLEMKSGFPYSIPVIIILFLLAWVVLKKTKG